MSALLDRLAECGTAAPAPILARLAALAPAIDAEGLYPEEILRALGRVGAFRGPAEPGRLFDAVAAMEAVASHCLSTAFCAWCQSALVWYLARTDHAEARRHLAAVGSGARLGGTGLSNPMKSAAGLEPLALRGVAVRGGYRVTGILPWVSNLGPDHLFASVFALADGRRVMALFDCGAEGLRLASPGRFVALEGTRTYSVRLRDVFVAEADVLAEDAATFLPRIRQGFVLLQMGMALGVAGGAARGMRESAAGRRPIAAHIAPSAAEIETRVAVLREGTRDLAAALADEPTAAAWRDTLRLRREASVLALDATRAAALLAGAAGFRAGSEVARRLREAMFVGIVSPSVKHIGHELAHGLPLRDGGA